MTVRFLFPFIACIIPGLFGAPIFGGSEQVPLFVTSVPSGHFAGVSAPMPSLTEARRGAVGDVVRQVLGAIGVQYDHQYGKGHVGEEGRGTGRGTLVQKVLDD